MLWLIQALPPDAATVIVLTQQMQQAQPQPQAPTDGNVRRPATWASLAEAMAGIRKKKG